MIRTRSRFGVVAGLLLGCALAARVHADAAFDVSARIDSARSLAADARYAEAIDAYREILSRAPESGVREDLARALVLAGRYDEAVAEYRALAQRSPEDFWLHRNLARALSAADRRDEASAVLDALIAQHPRDAETLRERALIARRQGDFATARRLFRQALAVESPQGQGAMAPGAAPSPAPAQPDSGPAQLAHAKAAAARRSAPDVTLPLLLGVLALGIGAGQARALSIRTYALLACGASLLVAATFAWLSSAA